MAKRQQRVSNLRAYAVIGAEQRLLQIAEEARAIFQAFPELRAPNRGSGLAVEARVRFRGERRLRKAAACGEWSKAQAEGRRRKMSAAARKRISEAQKARWAKQKAREAKDGKRRKQNQ